MMTDLFDIPVPHQRHSETSTEAAHKAQPKFGNNMVKVLRAFQQRGDAGLIDEEGQIMLGMEGNSYRPSRVTLEKRGLVVKLDVTRPTKANRRAAVYKITMLGEMEIQQHANIR